MTKHGKVLSERQLLRELCRFPGDLRLHGNHAVVAVSSRMENDYSFLRFVKHTGSLNESTLKLHLDP